MWTILKRELINYFKNPIFWAGAAVVGLYLFQMLSPWLKLQYFPPDTEFPTLDMEQMGDADVTEGYIPATKEQQMSAAYEEIARTLTKDMGYSQKEAQQAVSELEEKDFSAMELDAWLEENYSYLGGRWLVEEAAWRRGTAEEVNAYIGQKMEERPYSWYFSRKFADFCGLFLGFFAAVLLAPLYVRDTKRDTYELLHTKPVSPWSYIGGKILGGFGAMMTILLFFNLAFGTLCAAVGRKSGFPVCFADIFAASLCYIVPNLLMIACSYTVISLLAKSPYPAVPLLLLYMLYSNMGSRNAEGIYGYYGRPLAIMVRFPGRFLEVTPPPGAAYNQIFLLLASGVMIWLSVRLWERRRSL